MSLYGLPKIHKIDFSFKLFRPISSALNTPCYKLAEYLVPILAKACKNTYTIDT